MKNIIWLISLSLLFLLGIKGMSMTSLSEEGGEDVCVLLENVPVARIYSFPSQLPDADSAYVDAETLAGQFRVLGRSQRQLSVTYSLCSKGMVCRMAKYRLDALLHSTKHVYTSLPRQYWTVSSEHYVYGMRRILI